MKKRFVNLLIIIISLSIRYSASAATNDIEDSQEHAKTPILKLQAEQKTDTKTFFDKKTTNCRFNIYTN